MPCACDRVELPKDPHGKEDVAQKAEGPHEIEELLLAGRQLTARQQHPPTGKGVQPAGEGRNARTAMDGDARAAPGDSRLNGELLALESPRRIRQLEFRKPQSQRGPPACPCEQQIVAQLAKSDYEPAFPIGHTSQVGETLG